LRILPSIVETHSLIAILFWSSWSASQFIFHWLIPTHVKTHKLLQVCKQVVTNLFTSCQQVVFALLVPSCCNKFGTSC
jgi:hypothetical protein